MQHRYLVGETVELISAPRQSNRPSGLCRILARLPYEGKRLQYRVQSLAEQNQRIVDEDDLRPASGPSIPVPDKGDSVFSIAVSKR